MNDKKDFNPNDILSEYSNMNESELYAELIKATSEQKKQGLFDEEALETFRDTVLPMLNETQKEKLFSVLALLSNDY